MIPFEFDYVRPAQAAEAVHAVCAARSDGRQAVFYGGGTELLTRARQGSARFDRAVDLKGVRECQPLGLEGGRLVVGAARTLAEVCEADPWPFLSAAAGRVADHTIRRQITFGGHLGGRIHYREAALPLMLVGAEALVADPDGLHTVAFDDVYDGSLHLAPDAFVAQVRVDRDVLDWPFSCVKRTRLDWVDYPLVTLAAVDDGDGVRVAAAGLYDVPVRLTEVEDALADSGGSPAERAARALRQLPRPPLDDVHGTAAYRAFVLEGMLADMVAELGR